MIGDELSPRSLILVAPKNYGSAGCQSAAGRIATYQRALDHRAFDYRMPESHCHWTFVIWPATTSTSNGP